MMSPDDFTRLVCMETARRQTQNHLRLIERQIALRTGRLAVTFRARSRHSGRNRSTWTSADERLYQDNLSALTFARQSEVDAAARKLIHQDAAIAAFRFRNGIVASVAA